MKRLFFTLMTLCSFICVAQDKPTVATSSTVSELPTAKAVFFNPNVYKSRMELKGLIVGKEGTNRTYNDSVCIKPDSNTKRFDYKIISEDFNGYVIIQVLPSVKFKVEVKTKSTVPETYTESTVAGVKVFTKGKGTAVTTNYNMYNVLFTAAGDKLDDDTDASKYYFAIKKDDFKPQSKILLSSKIVGIPLIHPIKFRPKTLDQGDDIMASVTVSYNFGVRFKLCKADAFKQNFITIIPYGFGFGADKYFKMKIDGTTTADDKQDVVAFTYYQGGVLFTVQKVNFGVFTGFDKMIGKRKDWVYQDRVWFSFGLGYKLGDY